MAVIVPAAIAAAYGIYQVAHGAHQKNLAKKAAAANQRPAYNIPQYNYDNLSLAESRAGTGLDASSKQYLTDNADRGLSTSLNTILRGGGDANSASSLYDTYLNNLGQVGLMDNQARVANMASLVNQRNRMSDLQDKAWMINTYGPYADKQQQIAQQKAYGQAQEDKGIGTIASAAESGFNAYNNSQDVNNLGQQKNGRASNGYIAPLPTSGPQTIPVAQPSPQYMQPLSSDYGLDISKMNGNDATKVNTMLYGNQGGWNSVWT